MESILRMMPPNQRQLYSSLLRPEPMTEPAFLRPGEWDPVDPDVVPLVLDDLNLGLQTDENSKHDFNLYPNFFVPRGKRALPRLCGMMLTKRVIEICKGCIKNADSVEIGGKGKRDGNPLSHLAKLCCETQCDESIFEPVCC
uniref:Insulin-like domain-containing protein n=1 Tax=Panagrellus redivivus TaxID=6233 RepID=A0A7E4ZVE0_PANRE